MSDRAVTVAEPPRTQPALTFAGCPATTLRDIRAGHAVFAGLGGGTGHAGARAAETHGSAASFVRAACNDLLHPYRESASGIAVDLDTGRRARLRDPGSFIDLGDLAPSGDGDRSVAAATLHKRIAGAGARPVFVSGDETAALGSIDGLRTAHTATRIIEIGDRCLAGSLGFAGPVLSIGASGFQSAEAWRRQVGRGGAVVTAEQLHCEGLDAARDALPGQSGGGGPVCIFDCRAIDIGYAAGCDSFTVAGLTPEQFISLAALIGASSPPSSAAVIHLDPARDQRGHMESLVAEALLGLLRGALFEDAVP